MAYLSLSLYLYLYLSLYLSLFWVIIIEEGKDHLSAIINLKVFLNCFATWEVASRRVIWGWGKITWTSFLNILVWYHYFKPIQRMICFEKKKFSAVTHCNLVKK